MSKYKIANLSIQYVQNIFVIFKAETLLYLCKLINYDKSLYLASGEHKIDEACLQ